MSVDQRKKKRAIKSNQNRAIHEEKNLPSGVVFSAWFMGFQLNIYFYGAALCDWYVEDNFSDEMLGSKFTIRCTSWCLMKSFNFCWEFWGQGQ